MQYACGGRAVSGSVASTSPTDDTAWWHVLRNCIAISAGKGGVLKTTLAAHLGGLAAANGWNVLVVDADPQGNLMFDLGYPSDGGANLADAILGRSPLVPLEDVRPRLAVAPGGPVLDDAGRHPPSQDADRLESALRPITDHYDLIVIDSPARELWLRRMILTAARFVIVPSGIDRASRVGLPDVARSVREVRASTNPDLDVLAVVPGPIAVTHSRIRERARHRLGELVGDHDLVPETIIRHAPLVAEQCRELGVLACEYAELQQSGPRPDTSAGGIRSMQPGHASASATGLAGDWTSLAGELLRRFTATVPSGHPAPGPKTADMQHVRPEPV